MALPTALRPSSAARSCRWPGRPRSSCSPAPSRTAAVRSGRYRPHSAPPTGSRSDSGEDTAAAPWAPTACTWPPWCSPPPTRPCCPRARRRAAPPAGRRCRGSSRSTRCSAPRRGTPPRPADEAPAIAPLAVELSLVQNSSENSRYPSYSTHVRQQQLADDATRKLKLQARLVQPGRVGGWVAGNLSWSRLDYMLLRDEFPPAHVRLLHELFALYRASTTQQGYYTQLLLRRLRRRPEVPGPLRLRVPPALAGPRPGARARAAVRLPGQAGHRAAAGHGRAHPGRAPATRPRC